MRKTFAFILTTLSVLVANAQHKASDNLRLALIQASTDTAKFLALKTLGTFYYNNQPDSAIIFDQQAYLIAKKNNWRTAQEHELNNIASDYDVLGDYANSILYFQKSLRMGEQIGDDLQIVNVNSNIGAAYVSKRDYQKALPYLLMTVKLLKEYPKTHHKLTAVYQRIEPINLSNLGESYIYLHKLDSARDYLTHSYKKCLAIQFKDIIGSIKNDFGKIENLENKSGVALKDFKQAVAADRAANNIQDLSVSYLNIAKFYINHQYPDSAIFYARQALDIATKGNFKPDILNASQELYTYYKMANNLPLTLQYLELTTATKDSLFSQDKEKQLLSLAFNEQIM